MSWFKRLVWVLPALLAIHQNSFSQTSESKAVSPPLLGDLVHSVDKRAETMQRDIIRQTGQYLNNLAREERKLRSKLAAKDSAAANSLFTGSARKYQALQSYLQQRADNTGAFHNDYIGHLDSLKTTLAFLQENNLLKDAGKLNGAMADLDGLQDKFNQVQEVNAWLDQRKTYLQQELDHWGMAGELTVWKKEAYYYRAQIEEYKRTFESMDRVEAKALELISRTDAFKSFFAQHSELGRLFQLPGSNGSPSANMAGLQTIDVLNSQMQQSLGRTVNTMDITQQGIQSAAPQLDDLKAKAEQLAGGGDATMPDFKPNTQKTRTFLRRLEWGANVQSVKNNAFFPTTSDLALTLGYKLNSRSIAGIGVSYKLGWGKDIQHINLSSQGVGLRSYLDWKIKGSLWVSGGGELNFLSQFSKFQQLKEYNAWQKSVLLGLMKKYKAGNKMTGSLQLLYDILWQQQIPTGQPLLFRVGYSF